MKNNFLWLFSSFLALFTLTACEGNGAAGAGSGSDPDRVVIGLVAIETDSEWRKAQIQSIEAEAERRGMELRISDSQHSQDFQLTAMRRFIAQQVDVIILAPVVESGWDMVLESAQRAGIPVVLVDRTINTANEEYYASAVGSDFTEEGRLAARWIADHFDGEARVLEIRGAAGASATTGRRDGFAEIVEEIEGLQLVHSDAGNFSGDAAIRIAQTFITSYGQDAVDVIYAHNDGMGLAVTRGLPEIDVTPGEDVLVVSVDGALSALEAITEGVLAATVESNPVVGPQLFEVIDKILAGEEVERRVVVPTRVFDSSNAEAAKEGRTY